MAFEKFLLKRDVWGDCVCLFIETKSFTDKTKQVVTNLGKSAIVFKS